MVQTTLSTLNTQTTSQTNDCCLVQAGNLWIVRKRQKRDSAGMPPHPPVLMTRSWDNWWDQFPKWMGLVFPDSKGLRFQTSSGLLPTLLLLSIRDKLTLLPHSHQSAGEGGEVTQVNWPPGVWEEGVKTLHTYVEVNTIQDSEIYFQVSIHGFTRPF